MTMELEYCIRGSLHSIAVHTGRNTEFHRPLSFKGHSEQSVREAGRDAFGMIQHAQFIASEVERHFQARDPEKYWEQRLEGGAVIYRYESTGITIQGSDFHEGNARLTMRNDAEKMGRLAAEARQYYLEHRGALFASIENRKEGNRVVFKRL